MWELKPKKSPHRVVESVERPALHSIRFLFSLLPAIPPSKPCVFFFLLFINLRIFVQVPNSPFLSLSLSQFFAQRKKKTRSLYLEDNNLCFFPSVLIFIVVSFWMISLCCVCLPRKRRKRNEQILCFSLFRGVKARLSFALSFDFWDTRSYAWRGFQNNLFVFLRFSQFPCII